MGQGDGHRLRPQAALLKNALGELTFLTPHPHAWDGTQGLLHAKRVFCLPLSYASSLELTFLQLNFPAVCGPQPETEGTGLGHSPWELCQCRQMTV